MSSLFDLCVQMSAPFRAPPSTNKIPAFLRGESEPVNRAGGGYYQSASPSTTPAPLNFSKSIAPAPLNFRSDSFSSELPSQTTSWESYAPSKTTLWESGDTFTNTKSLGTNLVDRSGWGDMEADLTAQLSQSSLESTLPAESQYAPDDPGHFALTSLVLQCPVQDDLNVLKQISMAFDPTVEATVDGSSLQILGAVSGAFEQCKFMVQLSVQAPGSYIADFQRHSGSHASFASFFSATSDALLQSTFFSAVQLTQALSAYQSTAASLSGGAVGPAWEQSSGLDEASCHQLVDMLSSEFADVQQAALDTLASFSCSPACAAAVQQWVGAKLAQQVLVQLWPQELLSNALLLTANLCQVPAFAAQAMTLLPMLFGALSGSSEADLRHAARALELLTHHHGNLLNKGLPGTVQYLTYLEEHLNAANPTLQASIRNIIMS